MPAERSPLDGRWPGLLALAAAALLLSCASAPKGPKPAVQQVRFDPVEVVGEPSLDALNDEELFAKGTSAFAASDFKAATRYFGRLADFHPQSRHARAAAYNAGLSHEKLSEWEQAQERFAALADPAKGLDDALDASFRLAETHYHLGRYDEAAEVLRVLSSREDLTPARRIEARVQQGICELEAGRPEPAEATLRAALAEYHGLPDPQEVDDYFPSQGQFFLGEIYRLYFEAVKLDPDRTADELGEDLNYKAELLLSAQGHYLRAIRIGNGYWATAAGAQIGLLYETLHAQLVNAPAPKELDAEGVEIYREELRKRIRVLITKAIAIYEQTLETAERIGSSSAFVDRTKESLRKMKELLLTETGPDAALEPASDKPES